MFLGQTFVADCLVQHSEIYIVVPMRDGVVEEEHPYSFQTKVV